MPELTQTELTQKHELTPKRELVERFREVFDRVGEGAVERERTRRLPTAEIEELRTSGFTRVTLPAEYGGAGADHETLFELLVELARRDSHIAQALRSHFSFIDRVVHAPDSPRRDARLRLLADGAIHGNATFDRGSTRVGEYGTQVTADADGLRLDGRKFYTTGTLYADLVSVAATQQGAQVSVLLRTDAEGVERIDDWDGFGQVLTGSGTTAFSGVRVSPEAITHPEERASHGAAFVQLVLLAVLCGIGRAIVDDATMYVQARTRTYSHATARSPREDPLVQEVVGELSTASFAADAALAQAVRTLGPAASALRTGDDTVLESRVQAADLATAHAQLVVIPNVLRAATELFEVGGASAVSGAKAFDRHWRNARTVASHNPARFKARMLGDHLLNGAGVASWWTNGEG